MSKRRWFRAFFGHRVGRPWLVWAVLLAPIVGSGCIQAESTSPAPTTQVKTFEDDGEGLVPWYGSVELGRATTPPAHGGRYSLRFDSTSEFWGVEETWPGEFRVTPGVTYRLSAWLKRISGRASVKMSAVWVDNSTGATLRIDAVGSTTIPTVWTELTADLTAPGHATHVAFRFHGQGAGSWGLDDLTAAEVAPPPSAPPPSDPPPSAPPPNVAPTVSAGPDQTMVLPDAIELDGTVTDDGQTGPVTQQWSVVSGAGLVNFADPNGVDTTANFTIAGSYVLRLTATDGALSASDDAMITVQPESTTPPSGQVCTAPGFTSSDNGALFGDGRYLVHNNIWNSQPGAASTIEVCNFHSWNAITTATNAANAVQSYPNVHIDYHDWGTGVEPPLSSHPVLTSRFAAIGPQTGIYNVAYDIWINGVADGTPQNREVMVWTENHGQRPAGDVVATELTLSGHTWELWATPDNHILSFAAPRDGRDRPSNRVIDSATIDLRAMLDYLVADGRIQPDPRFGYVALGQVCFGVEVVDTLSQPATFRFTDFAITDG